MALFQREAPRPADSGSPTEDRRSTSSGLSKIAAGGRLEGNFSGTTDLTVEGRIDGKVKIEGTAQVVAGGEVHGTIEARVIRAAGKVVGNLVASDLVELAASAVHEGDIEAARVVIAEGAFLSGKVTMASSGQKKTKGG